MSEPARLQAPETVIAILLTLVAGYVDAVGFLKLGGIYVANMSGNSVAIGIHTAQNAWAIVLFRLWPVTCFALGLLSIRILADFAGFLRIKRIAALSFLLETALLVLFMNSAGIDSGIFFAALAMGIQAATVTKFNGVTVYTAFVTGSLVKFAENLSEWLLGFVKGRGKDREQASRGAIWFLGVWLAYVGGAIAGTAAFTSEGMKAIILACTALVGLAILDLFHPAEFNTRA